VAENTELMTFEREERILFLDLMFQEAQNTLHILKKAYKYD